MKTVYSPEYRALLEWIRRQRRERGLSMRALAARIGVPHTWVGKVETGERRLDVVEFVRLCRALELDPHAGISVVEAQKPLYETKTAEPMERAAEPPPDY